MEPSTPPTPAPGPGEAARPTRRNRLWSTLAVVVALAVLAGLAWYLTHRPSSYGEGGASGREAGLRGRAGARGAPPSTVGVATARHADVPIYIDALGTVVSPGSVTVTPQVSGVVTQVLYKEGEIVKKGQILATIDPRPFEIALDQATGARTRDEAQLDAARVLLTRYQVLLTQDSIARQTVDTQDALVKQLNGTVALDRANEASAHLNLQWSRIVAPVDGRVGLRTIDPGNYIAAGNAGGVATITRISPIDVEFSIPQERIPEIRQRTGSGAALPVSAWDSTRSRELEAGRFLTLDNQIDTQTGTIKAKARFENGDGALFPNQFVNVKMLLRTIDAALVVPVTALRHGPTGDFVYVVNADHTVKLRDVTAGIAGATDVVIAKGLALGEVVVTEGGDRLKDGATIRTAASTAQGPGPTQAVRAGAQSGQPSNAAPAK